MTRTSPHFLRAQAERLETEPQSRIMEAIPAFSEAEVHRLSDTPLAGTKVHPASHWTLLWNTCGSAPGFSRSTSS